MIDELERLHTELIESGQRSSGIQAFTARLFGQTPKPIRGLYLWGSVGRGKTLLMDIFYRCLPFSDKKRLHFHRFMASIHDRLGALQDIENPLEIIASDIADQCRVICFDEFAVNDIADAMILGNLFVALFERGVVLVATSNITPDQLYRDGLQRQRFLPAIAAIETNTVVLRMGGELDYRLRVLEEATAYLSPADDTARNRLQRLIEAIEPDEAERNGTMEILGRPIGFIRRSDGVAWFSYSELCDGPRSANDYIELAREFQTIAVSEVPCFTEELENQARRFIALVDELYDRRVKLLLTAEAPLPELYQGSRLTMEFERTRSRLTEMQSRSYMAEPHRP